MDDLADIEEDLMVSALIAAGTDRHSAQIFTDTVCALATGPTLSEVDGRGQIMADANGLRRALNVHGIDALDLRTFKKNGGPLDFNIRRDREETFNSLMIRSQHG